MAYASPSSPESITSRVEATLDYLDSPRGIRAWEENRDRRGYPVTKNYFAAIQSATGCIVYEHIQEVLSAIGPALNARNNRSAA